MDKKVEIISEQEIFRKFIFRIEEATLRHTKYDGTMSEPITRLNMDRGDSVAVLIHNPEEDTVLLTEQFKYPTYDPEGRRGNGWIIELTAGVVEKGENPESTARREVDEEIGYNLDALEHISSFYLSPGGTSERIILYYASVTRKNQVGAGGGVKSEGEDIKRLHIKVNKALQMIETGEIADGKTILALLWLQLNRTAGKA